MAEFSEENPFLSTACAQNHRQIRERPNTEEEQGTLSVIQGEAGSLQTRQPTLQWTWLDSASANLAILLSLLAPAPIAWRIVEPITEWLGWAERDVDNARMQLYECQFLQITDEGYYKLTQDGRAVARAALATVPESKRFQQAIAATLAEVAKLIAKAPPSALVDSEAILPHIAEAAREFSGEVIPDQLPWFFLALGRFHTQQGDMTLAEHWYEQGLSVTLARFGSEHPVVITSFNNLACFYEQVGQLAKAEPLYLRAIDLGNRLVGKDSLAVATSLNNLASLYRKQQRYTEAESLYQQALDLRTQHLGKNHPSIATSLNSLATFYYAQQRYDEAENLYRQALQLRLCLLGNRHPSIASSLNNLASVLHAKGQQTEATALCQQAVQLSEEVSGANHPDTIAFQQNLAVMQKAENPSLRRRLQNLLP